MVICSQAVVLQHYTLSVTREGLVWHTWVECQVKNVVCVLAVPDSAFNYRKGTLKTPKRVFLLSQCSAWEKEGGGKVYSFWRRSGWLFADGFICVHCSIGSSFLVLQSNSN